MMLMMNEAHDEIVKIVGEVKPKVGIICGSGLGGIVNEIKCAVKISYADIPGFPVSTVKGHSGTLVFGQLNGTSVMCFSGRFHAYEGHPMEHVTLPVRLMAQFGVQSVIITNASGSLDGEKFVVGDIVMIKDHISFPALCGASPLVGGPNFVPLSNAYMQLQDELCAIGKKLGVDVKQGIYVGLGGPNYETPAEVRFLRMIGGDMVGMSTTPEVIMAASLGMKVLGLSLVTNVCVDSVDANIEQANHAEVLKAAQDRSSALQALVKEIIPLMKE